MTAPVSMPPVSMPASLLGKVALVTGAARGLGRAYALRLASLGADVVVVDIDLNAAAQFGEKLGAPTVSAEVERLGRRSISVIADVSDEAQVQAAVEAAVKALGRIDILVNNAGGAITPAERSKASVSPQEDHRLLFDIN